MRFLQAGRLHFNHDIFSCAMVLLIIFLSKTRINFIYVNITYVYVTEFWNYVPSTLVESNLRKLPKCNCMIALDLRNVLAGVYTIVKCLIYRLNLPEIANIVECINFWFSFRAVSTKLRKALLRKELSSDRQHCSQITWKKRTEFSFLKQLFAVFFLSIL